MNDTLTNAKLIIQVGSNGVDASYVLTSSIIKVNPSYFSEEVFVALGQSEKELIKGLRELDEDVSINDLMVSLFSKERMH